MYDPSLSRWTTLDPEGFAAGQSNLYEFAGNGPTDATDPSGKELFVKGLEFVEDCIRRLKEQGITANYVKFADQNDTVPDGGDASRALYHVIIANNMADKVRRVDERRA